MRVVAFNGSPRRDGNTAILLRAVLAEIEAEGGDTELVQVGGRRIAGCRPATGLEEPGRPLRGEERPDQRLDRQGGGRGRDRARLAHLFQRRERGDEGAHRPGGLREQGQRVLLRGKVGAAVAPVARTGAVHAWTPCTTCSSTRRCTSWAGYMNSVMGRNPARWSRTRWGCRTCATWAATWPSCSRRSAPGGRAKRDGHRAGPGTWRDSMLYDLTLPWSEDWRPRLRRCPAAWGRRATWARTWTGTSARRCPGVFRSRAVLYDVSAFCGERPVRPEDLVGPAPAAGDFVLLRSGYVERLGYGDPEYLGAFFELGWARWTCSWRRGCISSAWTRRACAGGRNTGRRTCAASCRGLCGGESEQSLDAARGAGVHGLCRVLRRGRNGGALPGAGGNRRRGEGRRAPGLDQGGGVGEVEDLALFHEAAEPVGPGVGQVTGVVVVEPHLGAVLGGQVLSFW